MGRVQLPLIVRAQSGALLWNGEEFLDSKDLERSPDVMCKQDLLFGHLQL